MTFLSSNIPLRIKYCTQVLSMYAQYEYKMRIPVASPDKNIWDITLLIVTLVHNVLLISKVLLPTNNLFEKISNSFFRKNIIIVLFFQNT